MGTQGINTAHKINRVCDKDFVIVSTRFTPLEKAGMGESAMEDALRRKKRMGWERMLKYRAAKECPGIYKNDVRAGQSLIQVDPSDSNVRPYVKEAGTYVESNVAFCPFCKKMAELWEFAVLKDEVDGNLLQDPGFRNRMRFEGDSILGLKANFVPTEGADPDKPFSYIRRCPNCGADLSGYEKSKMGYRKRKLWNEGALEGKNIRLLGWEVHQKEEKIVMRLVYERYSVDTFKEEVHSSIFTAAVTMNMASGRTFALMPHSSDGKPLLPGSKMKGMYELTYGIEGLAFEKVISPLSTQRGILDAAWEILCRVKGVSRPEDDSFLSLVCANRFGGNAVYVSVLYREYSDLFRLYPSFLRKECAKIKFAVLPDIHTLLSVLKLPDRPKIRRMVTEKDPSSITGLVLAKKMGFRNYDFIVSAAVYGVGAQRGGYYIGSNTVSLASFFTRKLIKVRGEGPAFRLLFSLYSDRAGNRPDNAGNLADYLERDRERDKAAISIDVLFRLLADCGRMYKDCVDTGFLPELTGRSIREVHDTLCILLNEDIRRARAAVGDADGEILALRGTIIPYMEEERKLEGEYGVYRFFLLHDAAQFVELGQIMHNCVASYTDLALKKISTILAMVQVKGSCVSACIELRGVRKGNGIGFLLYQAKGKYNMELEPEEKDAVRLWMEKNGIRDNSVGDMD